MNTRCWVGLVLVLVVGCTAATTAGHGSSSRVPASRSTPSAAPTPVASATAGTATTPSPVQTSLVAAWRSAGVRPVSPVTVVGRTALVYGTVGKQLFLYGLDATSGRTRWRHVASTASTTQGVAIGVATVDSSVVYFGRLSRDGSAPLIIADAATGRLSARTIALVWTSTPKACLRHPHDPCASAFDASSNDDIPFRVVGQGGLTFDAQVNYSGTRAVGDQLGATSSRPESLQHTAGGRTLWSRPTKALFAPATNTDSGWLFDHYGATYAGTLYAHLDPYHAVKSLTIDLARSPVSAGFSADHGSLLWRQVGTAVDCMGAVDTDSDTPQPVRCRYRGSITYTANPKGPVKVATAGLAVSVEGFDPHNGRTTWSRPMGAARSLADLGEVVLLSEHQVVVTGADSIARVLDLADGALRAVAPADVFWCRRQSVFTQTPAKVSDRLAQHSGEVVGACDAHGRPTARIPHSVPDSISAAAGTDLRLVSTASGVVAYRVRS